jgi:hypothetical protein
MSGVASGGFLLLESPQKTETLEEVSPLEDVMREHGVLTRVLLVYRELIRRVAIEQRLGIYDLARFTPRT